MVLVGSQWFYVVLTGYRRFSVVLVCCQCSRRFSSVLSGSRRFSVFSGSRRFSVVVVGSQWFS